MNPYINKGDTGFSGTKNRIMIEKNSPVFHLLGDLDEFTSALGMARSWVPAQLSEILRQIQQDVVLLSGEIAGGPLFATRERVEGLDKAAESLSQGLVRREDESPETVVPGASRGGAALDLARAIVRRAEREAVALSQKRGLSRDVLAWLNRISHLIYAMARFSDSLSGENPGMTFLGAAESANPMAKVLGGESTPYGSIPGFAAQAAELCARVLAKAREMGFRATAAVCDSGGCPVCTIRDDGALLASVDIAVNKAYTSVSMKMSTRQLASLAQPGASLYGIQFTNGGRIVIFGGGVPLERDGSIVGGFGVSGGTEEQDTCLAEIALQFFKGGFHS